MYTQCPDCATVFRVSAELLRAAQGEVRCGVCSTTFNALENLSEQPFRAAPEAGTGIKPEDTITVEEVPGSEDIELSTSVEILQLDSPIPENPAPSGPSPEAAGSAEDRAMEFRGDAADLDRLFVTMPSAEAPRFAQAARTEGSLERTDEYPVLVLDERDEADEPAARAAVPEPEAAAEDDSVEIVLESPHEPDPLERPRIVIPDEMRKGLAEAARRASTAPDFDDGFDDGDDPRRWPWAFGVTALLLLLVAQVVHSQRDELIRQRGIGPFLAQAYAIMGLPFAAPTDLSAFELRQLGAANDTAGAGRLLLRASIVNRAAFAQPFPLLRLALQDRYGTTLRVRDIEPSDYLPSKDTPDLLGAGGRADAEIHVVDPGPDAVGFEMDICLKVAGGVRCANQTAAAAP